MSIEEDIVALKFTVASQLEKGDDFRALTIASRHMRAAALALEDCTDPRGERAINLLLGAIAEIRDPEEPGDAP